jgi:Uma2 family endonuclease
MSSLPISRVQQRDLPAAEPPVARTIFLPGADLSIPAHAHTLTGFRAWVTGDSFPERARVSFLDEEIIINRSPEELETHSKVRSEIGCVLLGLNKKTKMGEFYPNGTLVTNPAANLSTEPDATFLTWSTLESGRARLVPRTGKEGQFIEIEGTPDWVLEIVSDDSVGKDRRQLRDQYHRAGVPEYWLLDARRTDIDFQVLVRETSCYAPTSERDGWLASPLFGRRFRLVRQRGRMNLWEYTLQVKPLR